MRRSKPRVFLDSSALIAAIFSPREDSASRQLLRLGESALVELRVNREVLRDTEYLIRKRKPALLAIFALLLDQSHVEVVADASQKLVELCLEMTGYLPDARVLAAAVECDADVFATYDTEHFLQNPLIGPPRTRLRVLNAPQTVAWYLALMQDPAQETKEDV